MDLGSFIARAFVYPMARACCDAYFEARSKYDVAKEEYVTATDVERAMRFRDAVRVQHPTVNESNPEFQSPASDR